MIDADKIYAATMPDPTIDITMLALYVTKDFQGIPGIAYYTPGSRSHLLKGRVVKETDDGFLFKQKGEEGEWVFREVTYENFRDKYFQIVEDAESILEEVHSTQELQDWYHEHFPK